MFKRLFMAAAFAAAVCTLSQAADYSKVPNPMANAKAGQWVTYKVMGGMEQKQSIVSVEGEGDDRVITIRMEMSQGGMELPAQEMKVSLRDAKAQEAAARQAAEGVIITEEKITHNGKSYDAVVIEVPTPAGPSKTYMSAEIPVAGMIKSEGAGMGVMMELVDFGG